MVDKEYERICKKLGCEPRNLEFPDFETEDDPKIKKMSASIFFT